MTTDHRLEQHTLTYLQSIAWTDNPRRSDLEALRDSLIRFGYVDPLVVDDTSGMLVSGHGVLATLLLAHEDGLDAPARVQVQGNEWAITAVHVGLAPGEAKAYSVAESRTREFGGWNDEKLVAALREIEQTDLGLTGVGFQTSELEALVAKLGGDLPASFTELPEPGEAEAAATKKPVTCPHCGETFTP